MPCALADLLVAMAFALTVSLAWGECQRRRAVQLTRLGHAYLQNSRVDHLPNCPAHGSISLWNDCTCGAFDAYDRFRSVLWGHPEDHLLRH